MLIDESNYGDVVHIHVCACISIKRKITTCKEHQKWNNFNWQNFITSFFMFIAGFEKI